uniref:Uncharacterized protein n=1 Tax=Bubo bubo TaxID=30461 RepID=A0A8C0ENG9_BUBBB
PFQSPEGEKGRSGKALDLTLFGSSCSLPCAVARWLQQGRRHCSGTSDRSCSLEFSGWLANAKSKGKVMFIQWECLRQPRSYSSHLFRDWYVNFLSGHSRTRWTSGFNSHL